MKNSKVFFTFMLLLGLFVVFSTLGCQADEATEDVAEETGEVIKLGFIYSLSGAFSPVGNIEKDAVTLAIDLVNENGGLEVNGQKHLLKQYSGTMKASRM
jgi:branched-chain amino acid transport system substrate-binding protein